MPPVEQSELRSGAIDVILEVVKLPAYIALNSVRNAHDGTHDFVDDARLGLDQRLEISPVQAKHPGRSRGEERGVARFIIHERQLADQIPRLEGVQQRPAVHSVLDNLYSTLDHHMHKGIARSLRQENLTVSKRFEVHEFREHRAFRWCELRSERARSQGINICGHVREIPLYHPPSELPKELCLAKGAALAKRCRLRMPPTLKLKTPPPG